MLKVLPFLFLILFSTATFSYEVPTLNSPVVDKAKIFSYKANKTLSSLLHDFKSKTGNQIALLTIPSLNGEVLESVSIKVADKWKLGSEKEDNGLLILIAKKERKVRIEVGQGLEGVITDLLAKRIIDYTITPHFKRGDFDSGIVNATLMIIQKIDPKYKFKSNYKSISKSPKKKTTLLQYIGKGIVFLLLLILFIKNPWLFILLMSGGRGRGGGGFGGYSGGGGGFSGGGSSGGW